MTFKVYCYAKCGTCKKALAYLDQHQIAYETIQIRETPPSKGELRQMLSYYDENLKKLFNTSSKDYKEGNFKERLLTLSPSEAIEILSKNGNLIKRPFILGKNFGLVGFNQSDWDNVLIN